MFKKLLLILFGIVASLLIVEVGLRLFDKWLPEGARYGPGLIRFHAQMQGVYLPDADLWHKSAPNIERVVTGHPDYNFKIRTDSLGYDGIGFRDDGIHNYPFAVALGDSFTWGDGVDNDETWVELLEAKLGLDVANLGMSGYGSLQRQRILETYGLPLKPKLILWSFFPNDLYDDGHFTWREESGRLASRQGSHAHSTWLENLDLNLRQSSVVYDWLLMPFVEPDDEEKWERLTYPGSELDLTFVIRPYWEKRLDLSNERVGRGLELTKQVLLEVQANAIQVDADFVIIIFPFKEQTYWPLVSNLIDDADHYDVNVITNWLKSYCEAQGLHCLDLTPTFLERAVAGDQLYFPYDAHWNETGHKLAAQTIHQYLLREAGNLSSKMIGDTQ